MYRFGSNNRSDLPLALVVGAGGMGMAVARRLGLTHRLLLADRNADHLAVQQARLAEEGHDTTVFPCDVTNKDDIAALVEKGRQLGSVRTLAYVVGLSPSMGDFDAILRVNLLGAAHMADAVLPAMSPGGAGIFISSSAAHMGSVADEILPLLDRAVEDDLLDRLHVLLGDKATSAAAYGISKVGLLRLCTRLAWSWGRKGKRIVSLSPGLIATPMGAVEFEKSPGKRALFDAVPFGREGTMIEIANVVDFLASDAASFISGTDILVDGGMIGTLRQPRTSF